MKSEFYREVSNDQKMRKSTTKHRPKKQSTPAALISSIRMSKGLKSETRALVRSIDLNKKMKPSTNDRILRMSFSRPPIQMEEDIEIPRIQEKSAVSVCCKCEALKADQEKEFRSLRMHHEEERTSFNEKFIQMEKKYLLKESQVIKANNDFRNLLKTKEQMQVDLQVQQRQILELKYKLDSSDEDLLRMYEDIKRYQEQNKFFNHFLTAFVDQTRSMVQWCQLFQNSYEELPVPIKTVRKDLMEKKNDLDVILKESQSYQSHNFGSSSIKGSQNSSFFQSQQDCTESFMKYFKQGNEVTTKSKCSVLPFTEIKERNEFNEAVTVNKENIDTSNKLSFEGLIHSKVEQQVGKRKAEHLKDDLLRVLLAQAQFIEGSQLNRGLDQSKSHFDVGGSLLSSITKRVDHYIE